MNRNNYWDKVKTTNTLSLFELYHENSKQNLFTINNKLSNGYESEILDLHNSLPLPYLMEIELPHYNLMNNIAPAINQNSSLSNLEFLGLLLQSSYGYDAYPKERSTKRVLPSLDGIHPLQIYIYLKDFSNVKRGLWHYNVDQHAISLLKTLNKHEIENLLSVNNTRELKMIIFVTSLMDKISDIQGERAYRNVLIQAGKLIQNIYTTSIAENWNISEVTNYNDYEIEKILEIDGINHMLLSGCFLTKDH